MKQALCLLAAATTLVGLAGCSIAIDGAAALPAGYTAAISSSRTVESPTASTTSRTTAPTTDAPDVEAADPATPVQTTAYTWPSSEAPEMDFLVDADVAECFTDSAVVQSMLGDDIEIDAVSVNVAPFADGTEAHYCSYDRRGTQVVIVDVMDPVGMSAADFVHLDEQYALSGVGTDASYDQEPDRTSVYLAADEHVIIIDIYDTVPTRNEIVSVATAALAGYRAA